MKRFVKDYLIAGVIYVFTLVSVETYKSVKKYGTDEGIEKLDEFVDEVRNQSIFESVGALFINAVCWPWRFTKIHLERVEKLGIDD